MQKWRQWENANQDAWQLALEREAVIRPLAEKGRRYASALLHYKRKHWIPVPTVGPSGI